MGARDGALQMKYSRGPAKAVEIESLTAIGRPLWSKRFSETCWLRALTTVVGGVARAVGISMASITVPEI